MAIKDYITESKHGLAYHRGGLMMPICWKDMADFMADLEKATQAAFGMDLQSAVKVKGRKNVAKLHQAWVKVLKAKMRKGRNEIL
jgi:hypothetical protein